MRKRRSTVYVRPGKDITLYVPAETPPEVIAYLNRLKDEGNFSQGVIDILTEYVLSHGAETPETETPVAGALEDDEDFDWPPRATRTDGSAPVHPGPDTGAAADGWPGTGPLSGSTSHIRAFSRDAAATDHTGGVLDSQDTGASGESADASGVGPEDHTEHTANPAGAASSTPPPAPERKKLSLAQIFRQAQRNAGRLTDG